MSKNSKKTNKSNNPTLTLIQKENDMNDITLENLNLTANTLGRAPRDPADLVSTLCEHDRVRLETLYIGILESQDSNADIIAHVDQWSKQAELGLAAREILNELVLAAFAEREQQARAIAAKFQQKLDEQSWLGTMWDCLTDAVCFVGRTVATVVETIVDGVRAAANWIWGVALKRAADGFVAVFAPAVCAFGNLAIVPTLYVGRAILCLGSILVFTLGALFPSFKGVVDLAEKWLVNLGKKGGVMGAIANILLLTAYTLRSQMGLDAFVA